MPPMFFIGISPSLQMTAAFGLGLLKTLTLSKININQSMDDYNFYCLFLDQLAYRPATPIFQLALQGYSVASLPRALRFMRAFFFALRSRKFLKIKSRSTWNALKRIEMKKKSLWPIMRFVRSAKRERRSTILPTPCHLQGPKECPCQVSCRLD